MSRIGRQLARLTPFMRQASHSFSSPPSQRITQRFHHTPPLAVCVVPAHTLVKNTPRKVILCRPFSRLHSNATPKKPAVSTLHPVDPGSAYSASMAASSALDGYPLSLSYFWDRSHWRHWKQHLRSITNCSTSSIMASWRMCSCHFFTSYF
ncbi:hypothetical protein HGRIS_006502 [Hohenbuehelia grisea]|uniref:Uncharacterized protein n=1 Tax=Hohenbuehelia grisea TaxID=104357 RepID=A0ABR3J9G4_9AGAR